MAVSVYAAVLALLPFIRAEARAQGQDPWTMAAIVFVESRGNPSVVKHELDGSCSVGLAGINVPGCDEVAVEHLKMAQANLRAQAVILKKGAEWCRAHAKTAPCRRGGAIAQYNAGDPGYAARVLGVRKDLKRAARARAGGR